MRKTIGILIIVFFIFQFQLPGAISQNSELEWEENIMVHGSCSSENVYTFFQVNRTVVEILVNMTWETEDGYADLDMQILDAVGNVANVSSTNQMPETMMVREFPNRGRWKFVVVPVACGSTGTANYTAHITIRNIALPELGISNPKTNPGTYVTLDITSGYENVTHFFFDFGDGTDSGWTNQSEVSKIYESPGEYQPKGKVRYSDGTESDWVEAGSLTVKSIESEPDLVRIAIPYALILIFITILTFFMFKKRKGV